MELSLDSHPRCVVEIGVGSPATCRTSAWFGSKDTRVEMYEALPATAINLLYHFGHYPNVIVRNVAVTDVAGTVQMVSNGDSSCIDGIVSPMVIFSDAAEVAAMKRVIVHGRPLSDYDRGDIDIALIDVEGSEWKVLSTMISRPKFICIESHMDCGEGRTYQTPDWQHIERWLNSNRYTPLRRDGADWWFARNRS